MRKQTTKRDPLDPTPAEIRRRCARIQELWSDRERAKRAGIKPTKWLPPHVTADDLANGILLMRIPESN